MRQNQYFNYIEEKLGTLAYRINLKGKLNILDLHIHSENFYLNFLNELYGWNLENLNALKQNIAAIDLIDHKNKVIIQVSATSTKEKIESTLKKEILKDYKNYTFKFISISKDADNLRKNTFANPYNISFNPVSDIIDNQSILNYILTLDIDKQKKVYEFIKKELGSEEIDIARLDSNLASIINILSQENFNVDADIEILSFEIDSKIEYNQLVTSREIIKDYITFNSRLDKKYQEFDKQGSNKSFSILQSIKKSYLEECSNLKDKDADTIFSQVIENVKNKVTQSANYISIPIDELDICVDVLVVDAFIRCKIFKKPPTS